MLFESSGNEGLHQLHPMHQEIGSEYFYHKRCFFNFLESCFAFLTGAQLGDVGNLSRFVL